MRAFILILIVFTLTSSTNGTREVTVTLSITGITRVQGQLLVAVFNKSADFPKPDKTWENLISKVNGKTETVKISGLKADQYYAIAVYHDVNNNKELDKNFFGMPIEKYGFSNNARGTFSSPTFEEVKFKAGENKTLSINIY